MNSGISKCGNRDEKLKNLADVLYDSPLTVLVNGTSAQLLISRAEHGAEVVTFADPDWLAEVGHVATCSQFMRIRIIHVRNPINNKSRIFYTPVGSYSPPQIISSSPHTTGQKAGHSWPSGPPTIEGMQKSGSGQPKHRPQYVLGVSKLWGSRLCNTEHVSHLTISITTTGAHHIIRMTSRWAVHVTISIHHWHAHFRHRATYKVN